MQATTLFHFPGACSRVTMNALEEIGLAFEDMPVNILGGEQKSAGYLALNPRGKVPALQVGRSLLTENAAILYYLHLQHPHAGLLPDDSVEFGPNAGLSDLVWCAATVHPMVRQIRMPVRFTEGDPSGVKALGIKNFAGVAAQIAARVNRQSWWYGSAWSIVDVYLYWNYSTAASGGFDLGPYPSVLEHADRVRARPSFLRALAREQAAIARAGLKLPPGATL